MKTSCGIGARVAIKAQHWLRPYAVGIVIEQQERALKNWLVQFEQSYPGGGIDGDKLWCDESDFAEVFAPRGTLRLSHEAQEFSSSESVRKAALEKVASA
jgi:hypothetical protein